MCLCGKNLKAEIAVVLSYFTFLKQIFKNLKR